MKTKKDKQFQLVLIAIIAIFAIAQLIRPIEQRYRVEQYFNKQHDSIKLSDKYLNTPVEDTIDYESGTDMYIYNKIQQEHPDWTSEQIEDSMFK